MPNDLYDTDILVWSEQQAALLARLASGERVNAAIDWPRLIEEVHDIGISELRACRSLLRQAMLHLLKLHAGADKPAAHWRGEILGFLVDATDRFTPGMRQNIDVPRLYRSALLQFEAARPDGPRQEANCPFTLDDLLAEPPDLDYLLARLN